MAFLPTVFKVDVLALLTALVDELLRRLADVGVETAGKALVAGNHDDQHIFLFALHEQRIHDLAGVLVDEVCAAHQRFQHVGDHLRVGPRLHRALLRTAQLGRRNHLHGLGDLPRVLHTADAPP